MVRLSRKARESQEATWEDFQYARTLLQRCHRTSLALATEPRVGFCRSASSPALPAPSSAEAWSEPVCQASCCASKTRKWVASVPGAHSGDAQRLLHIASSKTTAGSSGAGTCSGLSRSLSCSGSSTTMSSAVSNIPPEVEDSWTADSFLYTSLAKDTGPHVGDSSSSNTAARFAAAAAEEKVGSRRSWSRARERAVATWEAQHRDRIQRCQRPSQQSFGLPGIFAQIAENERRQCRIVGQPRHLRSESDGSVWNCGGAHILEVPLEKASTRPTGHQPKGNHISQSSATSSPANQSCCASASCSLPSGSVHSQGWLPPGAAAEKEPAIVLGPRSSLPDTSGDSFAFESMLVKCGSSGRTFPSKCSCSRELLDSRVRCDCGCRCASESAPVTAELVQQPTKCSGTVQEDCGASSCSSEVRNKHVPINVVTFETPTLSARPCSPVPTRLVPAEVEASQIPTVSSTSSAEKKLFSDRGRSAQSARIAQVDVEIFATPMSVPSAMCSTEVKRPFVNVPLNGLLRSDSGKVSAHKSAAVNADTAQTSTHCSATGAEDRESSRRCFVGTCKLVPVEVTSSQPPDVLALGSSEQPAGLLQAEVQTPQLRRESLHCDEQDQQAGTLSRQLARVVTVNVEVLQTPMSTLSAKYFGLPPSRIALEDRFVLPADKDGVPMNSTVMHLGRSEEFHGRSEDGIFDTLPFERKRPNSPTGRKRGLKTRRQPSSHRGT